MARKQQRTVLSTVVATIVGSGTASSLFWNATPAPASVSATQTYSYSFSSFLSGSLASGATITSVGVALPTGWSINSAARTLNYDGTGSAATTTGIRLRATNGATTADSSIFTLTTVSSGVSPGSGIVTTLQLISQQPPATYPFTVGVGFAKGDVPVSLVTDLSNYQVKIKRTWSDGSVKHAIISGRVTYSAGDFAPGTGYSKTVAISRGAYVEETALTSSSIVAAAPTALVTCQGFGSVNLSTLLLSAPYRTWISGPEMVECHYRGGVGGGSDLVVWYYVRLYADGRMWVRAIVENGYLDNGAGAISTRTTRSYVPTVTINGTVVYNNGGASYSHYYGTRWTAEAWIGTDPQIIPKHDPTYLQNTKLVPHYGWSSPSAATLNALNQTYTPGGRGDHTAAMGGAGFQTAIGVIPNWEALYCTTGDARAYRSTIANSSSFNSYPIGWRANGSSGSTVGDVVKPSIFTNWTIAGPAQGGQTTITAGSLSWEVAHHPSAGYLAYILTGDYWHLETLAFNAVCCYLTKSPGDGGTGMGNGTQRMMYRETRGMAWCLRTFAQLAAIAPDTDATMMDYRTMFQYNIATLKGIADLAPTSELGMFYSYEIASGGYGPGIIAPWQHHYICCALGHASDTEAATGTTPIANLTSLRDFSYRGAVGMLGPTGSGNYHFSRGGRFNIQIAATATGATDIGSWFTTWGQVWTTTEGSANAETTNTLKGPADFGGNLTYSDPANAATAYWGNLMAALSFAYDHGAPGATAAFARLTGATNWSTVRDSGFDNTPLFGIFPRGLSPTLPSWVPAAGTFANVGTSTLASVRPSGWPASDSAGPFANWSGAVYVPNFSGLGAWVVHGSGHLSAGTPLWAGVWCFDLDDLTWKGRNVPAQALVEGGSFNGFGESTDAATAGHPYTPHTYSSLVVQSVANGGGTKGALLRPMYPGASPSVYGTPLHRFDLSSSSAAPTRVINALTLASNGDPYPISALDEARGGFWMTTQTGIGPLRFVRFSDWNVTNYSPTYNCGASQIVYIPAPWDCIVAFTSNGPPNAPTILISRIVGGVPQAFQTPTVTGSIPGTQNTRQMGGSWSTILNCIVSYPGDGGTTVYKLTPPAAANLASGSWAWTSETVTGVSGATPSWNGFNNGSWNRFLEIPSLRCFIWCDSVNSPVQAWRLSGM